MKFKKLKKLIAKTDYVRIVANDKDKGEYLSSEFVPDKYDDYQVVGFEHANRILVSDHKDLTGDGVEVVLQKKKKDKKPKKKNETTSKIKEATGNEFGHRDKRRKEKPAEKISDEKEQTKKNTDEE